MIVGIHQPNFLPWLGYFYKISQSDCFVFLDNVQFSKGSYTNRAPIINNSKKKWLTMSVLTSGKKDQQIKDVVFVKDCQKKVLSTIKNSYFKCLWYSRYIERISEILLASYQNLSDMNIDLISYVCSELDIKTKKIKSSELPLKQSCSTQKLVDICNSINADVYLSGSGGDNYQDKNLFEKNDIELKYIDYEHPVYEQYGLKGFIRGTSIIDILFNCGPESSRFFE